MKYMIFSIWSIFTFNIINVSDNFDLSDKPIARWISKLKNKENELHSIVKNRGYRLLCHPKEICSSKQFNDQIRIVMKELGLSREKDDYLVVQRVLVKDFNEVYGVLIPSYVLYSRDFFDPEVAAKQELSIIEKFRSHVFLQFFQKFHQNCSKRNDDSTLGINFKTLKKHVFCELLRYGNYYESVIDSAVTEHLKDKFNIIVPNNYRFTTNKHPGLYNQLKNECIQFFNSCNTNNLEKREPDARRDFETFGSEIRESLSILEKEKNEDSKNLEKSRVSDQYEKLQFNIGCLNTK